MTSKTIDFIGDCELRGSKKWHIPFHRLGEKRKRHIFQGFQKIPMGWLWFYFYDLYDFSYLFVYQAAAYGAAAQLSTLGGLRNQ
jgi:hypothetical protein